MTDNLERIVRRQIFNGEEIDVLYRKCIKDETAFPRHFEPLNPRVYEENGIICEQDVPMKLRDGTTIYTDIFRPAGAEKVPCIVAWSIYGKRPYDAPDGNWSTYGVPEGAISRGTKFEGPDPGYWCHQGYAVANPDPRGVGHSEGEITNFSSQEAQDGYDFIEWVAEQDWCTGKVAMMGNSMLAIMQWFIAAQNPPHLTCIAPWEGSSDIYRETYFEGGVPALAFQSWCYNSLGGELPERYIEDLPAMAVKYPFMNEYWKDKIPQVENIHIPVYATAGLSHFHIRGALNAFRRLGSDAKWMRIHREFEWPDHYCREMKEDLKAFFDRYLKNIYNGWEFTPRIRMDVMDAYDCDYQVMRPEKEFPLARTVYKKLYLDANRRSLSYEASFEHTSCSYDPETEQVCFDIQFEEDTEISGYIKLRLWVEAEGNDDMDLFLTVKKLDANKAFVPTWVFGERHPGAWGKIRASRRALDAEQSTDYWPVLSHTGEEKLAPGQIVPLDIEIAPHCRIWHKGEHLRVEVAGKYLRDPWFEPFSWDVCNKGRHIIHTGAQYDSYLQIPVIPPKYRAGDYVYR